MLYNDYYRRMSKVMVFFGAVKKHLLIILIAIAVALGAAGALMGTRGLVYDQVDCPSQIVYGQDLGYSAGAFLASNIHYEYRMEGSSEWTRTQPTKIGKYYVRAVSTRTGGAPSYGKAHAFTIKPKEIDVSVAGTVVFGENPGVAADLAKGDSIECSAYVYTDPTRNATTVSAVAESVVITDKNGDDVTDCYSIKTPLCPIVFTPRKIGITVADKTAEYDGSAIGYGGYELTDGTLAQDNYIVAVAKTTQTEVGTANVSVEFSVLDGDGNNVTANYDIKKNTGKITVTQRIVYITAGTDDNVYDGNPFACKDYTVDDKTPIVSGHKLSPEVSSTITNVGEVENLIVFKVFDEKDVDVSGNYSIVITAGKLTVTPRPVTVKSVDHSWEYDGEQHSDAAVASAGDIVKGHQAVITSEALTITDVGEIDNEITVVIMDGAENDLTANYKISYDYGKIAVTQREITVTTETEEFDYDGTEKSKNAVKSATGLVEGHKVVEDTTVGAYATIKQAGQIENVITVTVCDGDGNDKTANYKIIYDYGTLTVNPRQIQVRAAGDTHVYDGVEFSSNKFEVVSKVELADGQIGVAECEGSITDVGETENVITGFVVFDGEIDVTDNYTVELDFTPATLSVTPRPIKVTTDGDDFVYDDYYHAYSAGYEIALNSDSVLGDPIVFGQKATVAYFTTVRYVMFDEKGEITGTPNVITIEISDDEDRTSNYDITYDYAGELRVLPRPIIVTTSGETWVYDDETHDNSKGYTVELNDKDVTGEPIVGRQQTKADSYAAIRFVLLDEEENVIGIPNEIEIKILEGETDRTDNYDITYGETGELKVTPRPIIVTTLDKTWVYDAQTHNNKDGFTVALNDKNVTGDAIVGQQKAHADSYSTLLDVQFDEEENVIGIPNEIEIKILEGKTDRTDNYDITYGETGELKVTPRPITVTPVDKDIKFVFDGKQYTFNECYVTPDESLGEGAQAIVEEDYVLNILPLSYFTYVNRDENGNVIAVPNRLQIRIYYRNINGPPPRLRNVTSNYSITHDIGTVTVLPRPITVKAISKTKVYDGTPLCSESDDYEITSELKLAPGYIASHGIAEFDCKAITDVGETGYSVITGFAVYNDTTDETDNYDITLDDTPAELTVTKRKILVTTRDLTWVYDDETHDNRDGYNVLLNDGTISGEAIVGQQICVVVSYTTIRYVQYSGENVVGIPGNIAIKITDGETDKTHNYEIEYGKVGTLTVTPRPIKVSTKDETWVYDDETHDNRTGYEVALNDEKVSGKAIVGNQKSVVDTYSSIRYVQYAADGKTVVGIANEIRISIMEGATDRSRNYTITYLDDGVLKITPRPIKVSTKDGTWVYDDEMHDNRTGYEVTLNDEKVSGKAIVGNQKSVVDSYSSIRYVEYNKEGKEVIGIANEIRILIKEDSTDRTSNYYITYLDDGELKITPRPIVVTTEGGTWIFDDKYHNNSTGYKVDLIDEKISGKAIVGNQESYVYYFTSIRYVQYAADGKTVVGIANEIIIRIKEGDIDRSSNYDIYYGTMGTLKVTPRHITVATGHKDEQDGVNKWVYDGMQHEDNAVTLSGACTDAAAQERGMVDGHSISPATVFKVADVKDEFDRVWQNKFEIKVIRDEDNQDLTTNYFIHYDYGNITILPRPIIVTTATKAWTYDGLEHSEYTVNVVGALNPDDRLVVGHAIRATSPCTITEVGSKPNKFDFIIVDTINTNKNEEKDVTLNYEIRAISYGTLKINPKGSPGGLPGKDPNGNLDGGGPPKDPVLLMTVETAYTGRVYMRQASFGDYTGKGFSEAAEYEYGFTYGVGGEAHGYGMNYMPTLQLQNSVAQYSINVTLEDESYYSLPYFHAFGDVTQIQTSDTMYRWGGYSLSEEKVSYTVNYYPYMYLNDGGAAFNGTLGAAYLSLEKDYYNYVKNVYTSVPASTKAYLNQIINDNRFDTYLESGYSEAELFAAVAKYIRNAADYNTKYLNKKINNKTLDQEADMVVAFLRDYQEGVCRHYAASATLLLRTLGYPARYTCGFVATGNGVGNPVKVMSDKAHAWTEVYVRGIGWVPLEVTGSMDDSEPIKESLVIKPADIYAQSNPQPRNVVVSCGGTLDLSAYLKKGYHYEVVVQKVSDTQSRITAFRLYNPLGVDITRKISSITYEDGYLYETGKPIIHVDLGSYRRTYNGSAFDLGEVVGNNYTVLDAPEGLAVTVDLSGISITDVGYISSEMLNRRFRDRYTVTDSDGNNVSGNYYVLFSPDASDDFDAQYMLNGGMTDRVLEITPKMLTYTSIGGSYKYNGSAYSYQVQRSSGTLISGHTDYISGIISRADIGTVDCEFKVTIKDGAGRDVTKNYQITYVIGKLTIS